MSAQSPGDAAGTSDPIATVRSSAPRRVFALAALVVLGAMLLYTGLGGSPAPGWRMLVLVLGAGALVAAEGLRRATARELILSGDGLRDSAGTMLAATHEIVAINWGTFAFKPSHGFVLRLAAPRGRAWAPGLWWRVGRHVGVGGVTPALQNKYMAEAIAALVAERAAPAAPSSYT